MSGRGEATVAGAGALGLCCALALADAGFQVTVYDPADGGASAVAAGMLAPVFEAALDEAAPPLPLLLGARDLWPALAARAGVRLIRDGALAAGSADWLHGVVSGLSRLGVRAAELPPAAVQALAPGLAGSVEGVLLNREDWRLEPQAALAALRAACVATGVAFRREAAPGRRSDGLLVIATGAGRGLARDAPELVRLSPIKGHLLHANAPDLTYLTVRGEEGYVTPVGDSLALGATMEAGVDDPEPDPARAAPLLAAAVRLFPALAHARPRLLAGVRGSTPDGLPLAGFSAEPKVLLAVGARRNGWLLAPLVAQVTAALAVGADPGPWAAALDPSRFG